MSPQNEKRVAADMVGVEAAVVGVVADVDEENIKCRRRGCPEFKVAPVVMSNGKGASLAAPSGSTLPVAPPLTPDADDRVAFDDGAFKKLCDQYAIYLADIREDDLISRAKYHTEFETTFRRLVRKRAVEHKLVAKCRELREEIRAGSSKVQTAAKESHDDSSTIQTLRKAIIDAKKSLEVSAEQETRVRETNQVIKVENAALKRQLDYDLRQLADSAEMGMQQDKAMQDLLKVGDHCLERFIGIGL